MTVTCDLPGAQRVTDEGVISTANFSLSSLRARQERATLLERRSQAAGLDWYGALELLCQRVIAAERTGAPAVLLRDVAPPDPAESILLEGVLILLRHAVMLFGDGGALKSLLALWLAGLLAKRGQVVAYFDWEFSASEHRARLEGLFGPADMPPVLYVRCDKPLVAEADRLKRLVLTHGIDFAIFDSVAFGCDGPPESAEVAAAYFRVLRQLRIGSLCIAHVTKADSGDQRPFGSAFWHNSARATWFVKRSEATGDPSRVTVGLFHRKANTGPLRPALGFAVEFRPDGRISITRAELAEHGDFAAKLPIWQRMQHALKHGPMTLAALAEELDEKPDSLKKVVDRSKRRPDPMFTRVPGADGSTRIALVERRSA